MAEVDPRWEAAEDKELEGAPEDVLREIMAGYIPDYEPWEAYDKPGDMPMNKRVGDA